MGAPREHTGGYPLPPDPMKRSLSSTVRLVSLFLFLQAGLLAAVGMGMWICLHGLSWQTRDGWLPGTLLSIAVATSYAGGTTLYIKRSLTVSLEQQAQRLQAKLAHEQHLMQLQRNLVSMAAHEIRTPLMIIDAHAQRLVAMQERLSPQDLAARAGKIRTAVLRTTRLMRNLIESSGLIDGEVGLCFQPASLNLTALLHEVCHFQWEVTPQARILEEFGGPALQIQGDPNLLFQVFSNLLSNAVKYSPERGPIRINTNRDAARVAVSVEDRGIGVPPAEVARIFDRYYRGSNAVGIDGTGVGLYLVKTVVELHGGEITVETTEPQGSRFTVRLPLETSAAERAPEPCHLPGATTSSAGSPGVSRRSNSDFGTARLCRNPCDSSQPQRVR
jgi:signal transduction histidine kinase